MENEKKKMTLEELERDCTVVSNPVLQQSLDLVRHYNDRFYIKEETVTEKVPVRMTALGGLIPRGIRMEERTVTRYTILRMDLKGNVLPIWYNRPDGTKCTDFELQGAIQWLGAWIFNESPRHRKKGVAN